MSYTLLGLILLTVTLSACAQLALKMGVMKEQLQTAISLGVADTLMAILSSPLIWLGLSIYGLSVLMWLWVLSKVDLSVAYPFVGVSFIITMLFGVFLLNENVTMMRIIGTLLIAGGCILVGKST